jgi:hypothetical protein
MDKIKLMTRQPCGRWVWAFEYEATQAGLLEAERRLAQWVKQGAVCVLDGPRDLLTHHNPTRQALDAAAAHKAAKREHRAPPVGGLFDDCARDQQSLF